MTGQDRNHKREVSFADCSIEDAGRLCASFEKPVTDGIGAAILGRPSPVLEDAVKKGVALLAPNKIKIFYGGSSLCEVCRLIASLPRHAVCVAAVMDEIGWLAAVLDQTGRRGTVLFLEPDQTLFLATAFDGGEFSTFQVIPEEYALPLDGNEKNEARLLAGVFLWAGGQADSLQAGADMARHLGQ